VQDMWRSCGDRGFFLFASAVSYSREIQQPMRTVATLGRHRHTYRAVTFDRDQDRAGSLHPEGECSVDRARGLPGCPPLAAQLDLVRGLACQLGYRDAQGILSPPAAQSWARFFVRPGSLPVRLP
jgi:hypothetical protein